MSPTSESQHPVPTARRIGPWLLWFAVLGAATAWAFHLFFGWGVVELACLHGHRTVIGLPLTGYVWLSTLLPLVLALAGTAVAWRLRRRFARTDSDDRRLQRAGFTAEIGLAMSLLAVVMIVFGGAALLVFEPCLT